MSIALDAERLRAFLAVARELGFSRAAKSLGKTQSSVSQAVLLLERELGQALFVRDGRVARLTDAGKALRVRAERIFAEMDAVRAELTALSDLSRGELVIGTTDTFACYLLPQILSAFRARHPNIELSIDTAPSPRVAERVSEHAAHLGLVSLPLPDELRLSGRSASERLSVERVMALEDALICLPDHPLSRHKAVRARDLAGVPLLLLDPSTSTRSFVDRALAAAGVVPRVTMAMNSVEVLKRLVELGFGVSVVPRMAVEQEARRGVLSAVPLAGFGAERSVGLLFPRGAPPSPAAQAFARLLRESA